MRSVSLRLSDLGKAVIPIGIVGENLHTLVKIDCTKAFEEYPSAIAQMAVIPPRGETYPATLSRDGNTIIWEVTNSDLLYEGSGEIQLQFVVDETVAESFVGRTRVIRSIIANGEIPTAWENWLNDFTELKLAAEAAEAGAESSASDSEAYAVGKRGGVDVDSDDPTYHNNSKYYRDLAASEASGQIQSITDEGTRQIGLVQGEGTTQTGLVGAEGTRQIGLVEAKGEETIASIPSDYTTLSNDVSDLKSAISFTDDMIGAKEIVFTEGGYIYTYYGAGSTVSLTPTSNANYAYAVMDCVEGDTIHINGEGAGNAYLWSFIDSSDKMIEKAAEGLTGTDLVIVAPENSAKVILNSKLSSLGLCFKGSVIKNDVAELQTTVKGIKSQHLLQQSDLAIANSNFVVKDGLAYAVSVVSPYNCMTINAKKINFKYRRRTDSNSFYVGVCINGKFVGNRTNAVVTEIKTLYNTTNTVYADAVVNESVADNTYSTDYNDYTATLTGQVFELKKGQTTILKFTVADGIAIQGIAFLNYYFTYYSTTDNTDFKNGTIIIDTVEEKALLLEQEIAKKYQKPSGGIPDSDLAERYLKESSPIEFTTGYYIFTAGTVGTTVVDISTAKTSNSNYSYAYIDASPGDVFTINATGAGNAFLWTFLNSSGVIIARSTENAVGSNLAITAPENATKLIINSTNAGLGVCSIGESIDAKISKVDIAGNNKVHRMIAGVIRNTGSGWDFIVDSNHQGDLNCVSVGIANDGRLYVDYSSLNVKKVISAIFAPDEAFADAGYIMGASVGKTAAYIQIYQYRMSSVSARITFQNSGGVITPTISESDGVSAVAWDDTNKALSITHTNIVTKTASTAPIISFIPAVYGKYLMRLYSYSGTTVKVEFFDLVTGNKVTAPDTSMSLIFSRIGSALERIEIDPSTLVSASGNIWFMGIFEV